MEEEAPNIMDIYNLNLSSSDAESTASDCDSDNGMSNVIVEATYNVKSQKQSETLLKFKSQDDLMGYRPVDPGAAAMAPPDFGRSVNPISTRGTEYVHLITTGTPGFSDIPTTL